MTSYSPDDEHAHDSAPLSGDAITPRGGFMARPGLKPPPRHAVVVRGGDTPESGHIPRLRPSVPPAPVGDAAPTSASTKITLRAIPTPIRAASKLDNELAGSALPEIESLPPSSRAPLSDAPFVTSQLEPSSRPAQRASGSRWTIIAAAAAGVILGLASVAVKVSSPRTAAQPPPVDTLPVVAAPTLATPIPALAESAAPGDREATPPPSRQRAEPKRSPIPSAKRSIF